MRITTHPLHRSGLAELPHPAPVLSSNGVTDGVGPTVANRMRLNTDQPSFRLGVRDLSFPSSFLLTSRLPSTSSAPASGAGLFAGFLGTTQLSDFRLSFIIGVRL